MRKIKWLSALFVLGFTALLFKPSMALAADATIAGTVTHASGGTPVATILMYAENYATGTQSYAYTAADGTYTITIDDAAEPTAGTYTVYNYSYAYGAAETDTKFIRQETTVTLAEGQNKSGVNFSLTRRPKVRGYVYEPDGVTPVRNAEVTMTRTTGYSDGYGSDYSAASGSYTISPAPYPDSVESSLGEYTVIVSARGYLSVSDTITLSANETTITQNFTLVPASRVSGTITDTSGAPVSGATVTSQLTNGYPTTTTTATDGTFTVLAYSAYGYNGTAVGDYKLTVSKDGYVNETEAFSITADDTALTGYDFSLQTAGTFTGHVFAADGVTPVNNVTVTASDGLGNSYSTTSNSAGLYTFSNLRASTHYTITYSATGFVTESIYEQAVELGTITTAADTLFEAAVTFSGRVISQAGSDGIFGATVKLFNRAKPRSSTADYFGTTLTDGTFTITGIAPGDYRLDVVQTGFVTLQKNLVSLNTGLSGKTYKLKRAAAVFGQVTVNGDSVYNALVSVYSKNSTTVGYGSAYTDNNGYYRIASLKPGKYTIKVSGMSYVEKVVTKKLKQNTTTELNIKVGKAGSLSGIVRDKETGLPLSGYTVKVKHQTVSGYTDANGYYIIDGLAPGKYQVYIVSTLHNTVVANKVSIRSNKETKGVNFQLSPK